MVSNYTRTIVYVGETSVNATVTGNTLITQTRDTEGPKFYALDVRVATTQSVNVLTPATISIGTNSPNFDNICSAQSISPLDEVLLTFAVSSVFTGVPPLTDITVRVVTATVPVGGQTATHRFRVALIGIDS